MRGFIEGSNIPRGTGNCSGVAVVYDNALDCIARIDTHIGAVPCSAGDAAVPTGDAPRSVRIGIPTQHRLKNAHNILVVLQAGEKKHGLAVFGSWRWRHD